MHVPKVCLRNVARLRHVKCWIIGKLQSHLYTNKYKALRNICLILSFGRKGTAERRSALTLPRII